MVTFSTPRFAPATPQRGYRTEGPPLSSATGFAPAVAYSAIPSEVSPVSVPKS